MANQIGPESEGYWSEPIRPQYDDPATAPKYCDHCPVLERRPFCYDDCPLNENSTPEEKCEWYLEIKKYQLAVELDIKKCQLAAQLDNKKDCRETFIYQGGDLNGLL